MTTAQKKAARGLLASLTDAQLKKAIKVYTTVATSADTSSADREKLAKTINMTQEEIDRRSRNKMFLLGGAGLTAAWFFFIRK